MLRKKGGAWDIAIGIFLTLFVALSYWAPSLTPPLQSLELKFYDWRSQIRETLDAGSQIVLIGIDNDSIAEFGRWPWPRSRIAEILDKLKASRPRVIGLDIVYSEPEDNSGLKTLKALGEDYQKLVEKRKIRDPRDIFETLVSSAEARLDSDARLLSAIQTSSDVILPIIFTEKFSNIPNPPPLPPIFSSSSVRVRIVPQSQRSFIPTGFDAAYPIVPFAEAAAGIGHANLEPDFDGVVRRTAPVMRYGDLYIPNFPLALVLKSAGVRPGDVLFSPGHEVDFGQVKIPLNPQGQMMISFNGPYKTFRYYSARDVLNGRLDMGIFKDKIVLVGPTAPGIANIYPTPVSAELPSLEILANVTENILDGKNLEVPPWGARLEWGLIVGVGLFVILALPILPAFWGFSLSLLILISLMGLGSYLFIMGQWIKVSYPAALLGMGYLVGISRRFFITERGKELVEASAIETNKMLGLSFQGQGMLDLAFEKFRLCPVDEGMKDTLYNLALDFERKRQFAKAASVLGLVISKDRKYKDASSKITLLKQAADGAVFSGSLGPKKDGTVLISAGAAKPTLGRYEIEKELGRGAMGVVYLGRDPKINRLVAIKTMSLGEGSDESSTREIKERFFREAESAGKLNHPHIIRIFDAGEEDDVAYIAMELLDGRNLSSHIEKGRLLPPKTAMEYAATVAEALDYAHRQGIVHRDIKPANIMLLKDGSLRVADFGIARITSSSKTATGTVMGTPSYMSPEQIAGKKADGRADLFSLGATLFELLTGEKPFKGGDGIGALLFQIANDPHPDPRAIVPALPPCVSSILGKALAKNPEARYQNGLDMAKELRACAALMGNVA